MATNVPHQQLLDSSLETETITGQEIGSTSPGRNLLPKQTGAIESDPRSDFIHPWIGIPLGLASLVALFIDVGSDVLLGFRYFSNGDVGWGALTITFVLLPCLVWAAHAIVLRQGCCEVFKSFCYPVRVIRQGLESVCLQVKVLRGRKTKDEIVKSVCDNNNDRLMACWVEVLCEAIPQLLLQLYVMFSSTTDEAEVLQIVSVSTSILSASLTPAMSCRIGHIHAERLESPFIKLRFVLLQTISTSLLLACRALALALCASSHRYPTLLFLLLHLAIFSVIWWRLIRRDYPGEWRREILATMVGALGAVVGADSYRLQEDCFETDIEHWRYFRQFHANLLLGNAALLIVHYSLTDDLPSYAFRLLIGISAGTVVALLFNVAIFSCFCRKYVFRPREK